MDFSQFSNTPPLHYANIIECFPSLYVEKGWEMTSKRIKY
jgi:hypothetical protein